MAGYRQIHTKIWKDEWFIELEPEQKLFFIYLFSNDEASISGLYKLPIRVMMNETGLDRETITHALEEFARAGKVYYEDGVIWVTNMSRYHGNASDTTQKKVHKDIDMIPDCPIKRRFLASVYPIDTLSIPQADPSLKDKDKDKAEAEEKAPAAPAPEFQPTFSQDVQAEGIFRDVTGMMTFPGRGEDEGEAIRKIRAVMNGKNVPQTVEFMRPFYVEWRKREYSPTNMGWIDWCVAGEIPKNGHKPQQDGKSRLLNGV